jgi:aminoglycoside phosphotransferase (APT) family kinase protein
MDADKVGSAIVEISRKARFADTTPKEWAGRLKSLIEAQPEVKGSVTVSDVRPVAEAAGGSNGTLLFRASYKTAFESLDRALVLRFLPVSGLFHHYDVREQFELQRALAATPVPVAEQVWLDDQGKYLVRPGYIMAQIEGSSTPMTWMTSGILHDASPGQRRIMSSGYVAALAQIHNVDWKAQGLAWLEKRAKGIRPIERETNWYWDALIWSKDDGYISMLEPVRDWIIANEPVDIEVVLCHGDANFGNYLYKEHKITAVLDWEMSFLGTRECDLAFLKVGDSILLDGVPWPEGALTYAEMRSAYEQQTGYKLRNMEFFELFAAFRLAVINVLAMKHFPAEVLELYGPVLRRGPEICLERARILGAFVP